MKHLTALLAFVLFAAGASAQKHENVARGFEAGKSYALGDIDTVNMFNGNVTLSLPVGQAFPLSTRLSYRFMLHYNSLAWDIEEAERPVYDFPGAVEVVTVAYPDRRSNAGMGWSFGFGRLYPPFAMANDNAAWVYETADGSEHRLFGTSTTDTWQTNDGSFIRARRVDERVLVELPDGVVQEFEESPDGASRPWRIRDMHDLFPAPAGSVKPWANWVSIDYETTTAGNLRWKVEDSAGRKHSVTFRKYDYDTILGVDFVESVQLDGWSSTTPTYHFTYYETTTRRHTDDTDDPTTSVYSGGLTDLPKVQGLTQVKLTDGAPDGVDLGYTFDMTYRWESAIARDDSGVLRTMRLPTKGKIEWVPGNYKMPVPPDFYHEQPYYTEQVVSGLRQRIVTDPATGVTGTWTYTHSLAPAWNPPTSYAVPKESVTTVTDPSGNRTQYFFSVWMGNPFNGWTREQYGMAVSPDRPESDALERFVTKKEYQGASTLKRTTYVKLVGDRDYSRMEQQKVVYEDDIVSGTARYIHTSSDPASYDGYGHYRTTTTTTNFNGSPRRESYTNYTPVTSPWLINLFTEQKTTEFYDSDGVDKSESRRTFQFNTGTGFLEQQRTLVSTGDGPRDIREVFTADINGNVRQHDIYGGDNNDAGGTTPRYRLVHTYAAGVPKTSRYQDPATGQNLPFLTTDIDVDTGTSLPNASRDTAGRVTTFTYDAAGRIETITPPGAGANVVHVDYSNAVMGTTFAPATIAVSSGSIQRQQQFDGFGRLWREKTRMPDGTWSLRETGRNAQGWTVSVSEPETIPSGVSELDFHPLRITKYEDFDRFGRAWTVTKPDAQQITFSFTGDRVTRTTAMVQTAAGHVPSVLEEERDGAGRLYRVRENADAAAGWLESTYEYDAANRLVDVQTVDAAAKTQARSFEYDGRGFLTAETHPESGRTEYTYDARGHAITRTTPVAQLAFQYDAAGRILEMYDGGLPLKEYAYDRPNVPDADFSLGKLDYAIRHNRVLGKDTLVKETYTYGGLGGALSARKTSISTDGVVENTFEEQYTYDPNGAPQTLTYPTCAACQPAAPQLTVLNTYNAGLLEKVGRIGAPAAFASAIDYHASGMWTSIRHTNVDGTAGPLDSQVPDPVYPVRPKSIAFSNFCTGFSVTGHPVSVSIPFASSTELSATAAGATSWTWFANGQEIPASNSPKITVTPASTTTYFARAHNGTCTADSAQAVVTVGPDCSAADSAIALSSQPQPLTTVLLGTRVPLSVSASSAVPLTYQWFEGNPGSAVPIENATEATYTTLPLTASTRYWVRVTNACGTVDSAVAVVNVDPCTFTVVGKGPSDLEFKDAAAVSASDYIVAQGAYGVALAVDPRLIEGQESLQFHYAWSDDPAATGPVYEIPGPITMARTITATVTGTRSGFSCTRTVSFRVTPCNAPLEVEAGSCLLSNRPEAYVRLGTVIPLRAEVMKVTSPYELTDEELSQVRFTWKDASGAVIFDGTGAAGMLQSYQVPSAADAVPSYLELTVADPSCRRTLRMPLIVLNESPCNAATDPNGCSGACLVGLVRVNGFARQSYQFTGHEQVVLTPPSTLPLTASKFEWHRVTSGVDEVVGITSNLALTLMTPAKYYVRGLVNGVWYTSATLTTALTSSSAGITVTPPYQEVRSGGTVAITVDASGGTPAEYEWRIGDRYDLSTPVIGNGSRLEIAVRHDRLFWCRVKLNGVWLLSPVAEVVTTCTPTVSGTAVPHPPFVERDGFTLIGASAVGKISSIYWYERNADGTKKVLTGGLSSAINYYPKNAVTTIGADLADSCGTTGSLTETTIYLCVPTIAQQPAGTVIAGGTAATLTASATPAVDGQTVVTTWYDATDVNRTTPLGSGESFTTPLLPAGTVNTYVADFRSNCATGVEYTVRSAPAVVEACAPPVLTDHTALRWSTAPGSEVALAISADGKELTYQWYEGPSGDTSKPLPEKTERQLLIYPLLTTDYWCRIKSQNICVTDTPVTRVRVCSPPAIVAHPQSARAFENVSVTLSTTADAGTNTEPLSYQWQQHIDASWTAVTGATERTFTTTAVSGTPLDYRVVVSAGICSTTSSAASVTMCAYPQVVAADAPETTVAYGASISLRLPDLSPVEVKQVTWYRGASGDRSQPMRSGVGTNFSNDTGPITADAYFWAEFTHEGCASRTETYTVRACIPQITEEASDVVVAAGSAATLTIAATPIADQTYQWYAGSAGDTTSPVTDGTAASVTVSPAATTTYWCRVTTPCGLTADSRGVSVTTCTSPQITSITSSQSVPAGATVQLNASATGTELDYQWYRGAPGDVSDPIGTGATVSQQVNATTTFWCRVKSRGVCTVDSATTTVSICTPPSITTHPASQPLFAGNSATLSVAASPLPLTYQWYVGTAGTTTSPIANATSASITVQPAATTSYWVRVSNGGCHVQSNTATVTACVFPPQVNASPAATNIESGETVTLSLPVLTPAADKDVYWYRGAPGVRTALVASGLNATYRSAHTQSAHFWAEFTHNGCTSATTAYAISVCKPVITAEPQSSIINAGQTASLSVTATGEGLTYQWYLGMAGNTTSPIAGATQRTYAPAPASTTSYWVRVTGCAIDDSATATVTICQPPQITGQPQNAIKTSSAVTLTVTATGTELTYQWYEGTTALSATSASVTVSPSYTTSYRVRVAGRCGSAVDSNEARVSVAPSISTQPASAAVTSGTTRTLAVSASGTLLSYQWYERAGGAIAAVTGATATSYTTPAITSERRFFCRVRSGEAVTDSNDAVLTVCQPAGIAAGNYPSDVSGSLFVYNIVNPVIGETYEWYQGSSGQTNIPLGTGTSLSVRPVATTQYWARTKRPGCDADSLAVTAKICIPAILEQPQSDYVFAGTQKTLSVSATGTPPLTYQWFRGAAGDTSTPVGQGLATYTFTANATASYWVRVSSPSAGCTSSSRDSAVATVTVCTPPRITEQPRSDNYTKNAMFTLSVTAEGENLHYQWYRGNKGDTSHPVGDDSCSLTLYASATQAYWVRVTGNCASVDSETALTSVFPTITQQPASTSVCALGESASFSVAASGADSYQWYRIVNGGAAEPVGTGASLSVAISAVPVKFYALAVSGNAAVRSSDASATVAGVPTITSFTAPQYSTSKYTLTATVASADSSLVGYRFYQGAVGNTTTLLQDSTTNYKTVTPPTLPMQYWVRVYYRSNPTRCFADAGLSVP